MSRHQMREERKVVTAVFADVVGSTEITERMDPEDARDVLGAAVRTMVEAVERFGGTVKDLAGDGVLALFGAPIAHEDDAERAVRAALEIVRSIGEDGLASDAPALSVRVGIESGLVVLGPVGAGSRVEYGATGDALNVAARLQSHASPGSVLVGEVTQRAVRERFVWGEERSLTLKGKAEPVSAFEVVAARDRAPPHGAHTVDAPLIGRSDELVRATELAKRAVEMRDGRRGRGGLLLVAGEPGIGKSRLVAEVRRALDPVRWLEGRCVSFGRSTPYLPFREPILEGLEIAPDEPDVAAALRSNLIDLIGDGTDDIAPYLEAILGLPGGAELSHLSAETLQARTFGSIASLMRALVQASGVVVCIEDLHWADPSTLQSVGRLLLATEGEPVLYVLTVRSGEGPAERLADLASTLPGDAVGVIELRELPTASEDELLEAMLGGRALPADLRRRIVDAAGGNPFFTGELVRSLIDSGVLQRSADGWAVSSAGIPTELPTTIEKVILARLDVLEPEPHDVLTAAAVLGRQAPTQLLERIVETDPRPAVDELCRLDLLEREDRPEDLRFKHALIQEVAYATLLKRRRRELHARTVTAIGELWPDRMDEHLGVLAHHHRGAGQIDAARKCHALAAERAERLHAVQEMLEHLTWAIGLAEELERPVSERDVAELFLGRARSRARTGDVRGASEDLERILATHAPADVLMRAHEAFGSLLAGAADYREAVPHLQAALEAAIELADGGAQVSALNQLAIVHTNRLDFNAGLDNGRRALALAESSGDERQLATAMDGLKQVALQTGDFETLERLGKRLAEIHRRNDDLWLLQFALEEVGVADIMQARLDAAFERLEEALAINQRIGDLGNQPLHLATLGWAHRSRGDYGRALAFGRQAFELALELEHGEWIAWSAVHLAGSLLEVGLLEEAGRVLETGVEAATRAAADIHLVRCLGLQAWTSWRLGDRAGSVELAGRARSMLERIRGGPQGVYVFGQDAYLAVARVHLALGEPDVASSLVLPIVAACEGCGWVAGVVDGRLLLSEIAQREGDLAGAMADADRALHEAERAGLPAAWRVHAALADAHRAAGDDVRAHEHAQLSEVLVAELAGSIEDEATRVAFTASAADRLSGGRER